MKTHSSRIRGLLREGRIPTILKINLSDPRVIEIAGLAGADAVWLCAEHVANDWLGLENQIRAARLHNIDSIVRVARGSYSDYIRPLECGAAGVIVPHVSSAPEARQIVDWVRFHPVGKRALDGGNIDGQFCLLPLDQYMRQENQERLIVLQIESPEALDQVEAIAAVPGYDGLMFGPGDFSHRIGKAGQLDAPEVVAARRRVALAATKNGKIAFAAGLIAPFPTLIEEGYRVFGIGADVIGLGAYIKQRVELFHDSATALPKSAAAKATTPYA